MSFVLHPYVAYVFEMLYNVRNIKYYPTYRICRKPHKHWKPANPHKI